MLSCLVWKIQSPQFSCIWSSMKRKVIGLGNIEGPYQGAWNFQGKIFRTIYAPCKNIVMLSCLVSKIQSPQFSCIWSSMKRKDIGLGNIEGPYPGAWNFQGGSKGTIFAPCQNIVMLSCLVWKIRPPPPFSCVWSYMKRKVIGLGNIEGPYPGAWNFQGGAKRTIYAPCKNIVMLSCLVWKIRSPHFHVYGLICSEKSSGSETSKAPTQGPEIFRVSLRVQSTPPVKI